MVVLSINELQVISFTFSDERRTYGYYNYICYLIHGVSYNYRVF